MGLLTKEEHSEAIKGIKKIQEEIKQFAPIVTEDLKSLSEADYMRRVCNSHIEYKIRQAKEGDFLYECSFYNRKYFNAKNRLGKTPRELPGIEVNVAGLAKFIIDCPHYIEFLCKLKSFLFEPREKEVKSL